MGGGDRRREALSSVSLLGLLQGQTTRRENRAPGGVMSDMSDETQSKNPHSRGPTEGFMGKKKQKKRRTKVGKMRDLNLQADFIYELHHSFESQLILKGLCSVSNTRK